MKDIIPALHLIKNVILLFAAILFIAYNGGNFGVVSIIGGLFVIIMV